MFCRYMGIELAEAGGVCENGGILEPWLMRGFDVSWGDCDTAPDCIDCIDCIGGLEDMLTFVVELEGIW